MMKKKTKPLNELFRKKLHQAYFGTTFKEEVRTCQVKNTEMNN